MGEGWDQLDLDGSGDDDRIWTESRDEHLVARFESVYEGVLGSPPSRDLLTISTATGAIRISYSGTTMTLSPLDDTVTDLLEAVEHAAFTIADFERQNDWH